MRSIFGPKKVSGTPALRSQYFLAIASGTSTPCGVVRIVGELGPSRSISIESVD